MNREEIIKAICWELANYKFNEIKEPTEKTAEHILNLCAEYYGYLHYKEDNQK